MTAEQKTKDVEALLALLTRYSIGEFEYRDGKSRLKIVNGLIWDTDTNAPPPSAIETRQFTANRSITSPGVGRFHPVASPSTLPRRVLKGEIVAFVATGPVLQPVCSPENATLLEQLRRDGEGIGYGCPLYSIEIDA